MKSFRLHLPPFRFEVKTNSRLVVNNAKLMYGNAFSGDLDPNIFIDYRLSIINSGGLRRLFKSQASFMCDSREPFKPLSANQAYAVLEWGMNWTVAAHELQHVIVHSAVLEKNGKAVIFPAPPGSGKSTLTSYLANNGWRLLSDEMALILPNTQTVVPFVRPVCLKNRSIKLAKTWFPDATFSSIATHTHKGDVIHMAPTKSDFEQAEVPAKIIGVVFPKFNLDVELDIYKLNMTDAFMKLVNNAFNFNAIGTDSFDTVTRLIENTYNFEIEYNSLKEVDAFLTEGIINDN